MSGTRDRGNRRAMRRTHLRGDQPACGRDALRSPARRIACTLGSWPASPREIYARRSWCRNRAARHVVTVLQRRACEHTLCKSARWSAMSSRVGRNVSSVGRACVLCSDRWRARDAVAGCGLGSCAVESGDRVAVVGSVPRQVNVGTEVGTIHFTKLMSCLPHTVCMYRCRLVTPFGAREHCLADRVITQAAGYTSQCSASGRCEQVNYFHTYLGTRIRLKADRKIRKIFSGCSIARRTLR